jgi:hypothetical protein
MLNITKHTQSFIFVDLLIFYLGYFSECPMNGIRGGMMEKKGK